MYAPLAQALARMAFDDLMTAVVHVPAFMYFYWLVGLRRSAGAFFIFIAINWLSLSTYATCSVALSYVIGVDWLVTLINTTTLAMWAVTSGVFTSTSGVPVCEKRNPCTRPYSPPWLPGPRVAGDVLRTTACYIESDKYRLNFWLSFLSKEVGKD